MSITPYHIHATRQGIRKCCKKRRQIYTELNLTTSEYPTQSKLLGFVAQIVPDKVLVIL